MSLRRGELLNGTELILFPLESHFLSAIQRRCVKLQDATRGFMVCAPRREASEVSGVKRGCLLKQAKGIKFISTEALRSRSRHIADVCTRLFQRGPCRRKGRLPKGSIFSL